MSRALSMIAAAALAMVVSGLALLLASPRASATPS